MHKWLFLMALLWTVAGAETAYRWVDEFGQVHYSDRPMPGASQIELVAGAPVQAPSPAAQPTRQPEPVSGPAYTGFNVLQPAQQETLWGTGGAVEVAVEIAPALLPDHHLGFYLDGQLTDLNSRNAQFQLEQVDRGIHTLQAVILDAAGAEVIRTLAVTFMMQQTSINFPSNPNNPNRAPAAGG